MTRCLWVGRTIPLPLTDGSHIATANTVAALADAGCEVVFLGLENPGFEGQRAGLSEAVTWKAAPGAPNNRLLSLFSRRPMVAARFHTEAFRRALEECLKEPWDAVVLDHYALVWAVEAVRRGRNPAGGRPIAGHYAHDFETEVTAAIAERYDGNPLRKYVLSRNAAKTEAAERSLALGCDLMITVTEEDAANFTKANPQLRTLVCFPGNDAPRVGPRSLAGLPRSICIVGSYRWIAKQMNLQNFLQQADAVFAEAGVALDVIGDAPEDFVRRLAPQLKATRFLGFVPNLADSIGQYRMGLIVEETGGGFKLKTLDYIFGRLAVGALEGSFRGIPEAVAKTFFVEKDAAALAHAAIAAIDNPQDLEARQDRAFAAADGLFQWRENGRRILEAISS